MANQQNKKKLETIDDVRAAVKAYMADHKCTRTEAYRVIKRRHPEALGIIAPQAAAAHDNMK